MKFMYLNEFSVNDPCSYKHYLVAQLVEHRTGLASQRSRFESQSDFSCNFLSTAYDCKDHILKIQFKSYLA